jgi:hypothetical protein
MRFRHHDGICNPCRVPDFADDLGYLQLPHLRDDEVLLVLHLTSDFLLYRVSSQEHYKMVLNHLPWYPEKTGWVPGERVRVVPEESDERVFLFIIEACPMVMGQPPPSRSGTFLVRSRSSKRHFFVGEAE